MSKGRLTEEKNENSNCFFLYMTKKEKGISNQSNYMCV